jgi:lysozyme
MASLNGIVDLSHWDGDVDLAKAKSAGIVGVINKATQGFTHVDPTFKANCKKAKGESLLLGAYHFGAGGDPIAQADFFLNTVRPTKAALFVLDFEHNPTGTSMSLDEAREFVSYVKHKAGRWPVLYAGSYLREKLGSAPDSILSNCPLWLAQYGPTPIVPAAWQGWTMWQYTDGAHGNQPHQVSGIGRCDRSYFNGDANALATFWNG